MFRPVAQLAERRSPKPQAVGSIPSWPANKEVKMTTIQQETKKKAPLNFVLWLVVLALFVVGVWTNYHYQMIDSSLRTIAWIVLVLAALVVAYFTTQGKQCWQFAKEARNELRKVVWPTRPETVQTTLIVIGLVILLSLIIWGLDSVLLWAIAFLTGHRG